jgi:hypothetical protein
MELAWRGCEKKSSTVYHVLCAYAKAKIFIL